MKKELIPEWLMRLIIMLALPTVSCFGYYSLEHIEEKSSFIILLVILSYPVALLG